MAVYYKFKSAKDYDSIAIDGHFISVANLKEKIFESKHLGRGTDFDLVVTNAQTNEEYLDEAMLIPKNTSVLIRRVPGRPRQPIVTKSVIEQNERLLETNKFDNGQLVKSSFLGADSSVMHYPEDSEWDEFGNDLYAIPEVLPVQAGNPIQDALPPSKADEDTLIKALIDTPALDWQRQTSDGFGPGRGFGRGTGGRLMGGCGFGRGGLERKTPPQGYICHRCKVPGHFIQHCPTNGDPNYDIKRVKPPTGIPRSMLMSNPDGSYALPSGDVAVLKPNEAAFEKEIEGMPSSRSVGDLPPELHCPLCKDVIKDAVLTSKCCFTSFCDKCIRDHIISKSMCICGATNILADDLLPNKTLRDTISRILESNNSSTENAGSAFHVQDMESKISHPKMEPRILSPTCSATSKEEQEKSEGLPKVKETRDDGKIVAVPQKTLQKEWMGKAPDAFETTRDSTRLKEPASQGSAPLADGEVHHLVVPAETGKKKKKKKARLPMNGAEIQWKFPQDNLAAENYNMYEPLGPSPYNPFWNGMPSGMEGYATPYGGPLPYMGYGFGPFDFPFGVLPQDPFGAQGFMMPPPVPPQRDVVNFGMGFNSGPPVVEAQKNHLQRKREIERGGGEREFSKEPEFSREVNSSGDGSTLKSKSKSTTIPQTSITDHHRSHRHRSNRPSPERPTRDSELPHPSSKRKSDYDYDDDRDSYHHHRSHRSEAADRSSLEPPSKSATTDRKHKPSVFSRISFPEVELPPAGAASKKRKLSSSSSEVLAASSGPHNHGAAANGYRGDYKTPMSSSAKAVTSLSKKTTAFEVDYESSDDERHFKRRPSRYESSPPPAVAYEEETGRQHSRGSRDRERDRGGYSKHR